MMRIMSRMLLVVAALPTSSSTRCCADPKSCHMATEDKQTRHQCEAVTKSSTRCKRNSIPCGKFCRQHQRINVRFAGGISAAPVRIYR